jgi:hypothetical protein
MNDSEAALSSVTTHLVQLGRNFGAGSTELNDSNCKREPILKGLEPKNAYLQNWSHDDLVFHARSERQSRTYFRTTSLTSPAVESASPSAQNEMLRCVPLP